VVGGDRRCFPAPRQSYKQGGKLLRLQNRPSKGSSRALKPVNSKIVRCSKTKIQESSMCRELSFLTAREPIHSRMHLYPEPAPSRPMQGFLDGPI